MRLIKKAKKNNGNEEEQGSIDNVHEDRLSDLPDAIIINILSLLPTILAVRMSVLSKRWRYMWTMITALDFCDSREMESFKRPDRKNQERNRFFRFVDECLGFPYADTIISNFKLDMNFYGAAKKIDGWLRFPVVKNVKELDLSIMARRVGFYCLPEPILRLSTLTLLKLQGIELKTLVPIILPCLKSLYLTEVRMKDQILASFISGSPLETLHVRCCYGLLVPRLESSSLKFVEFENSPPICNLRCIGVKIRAKNLESFEFDGEYAGHKCIILLHPCPKLRNLSITGAHLMELWMEYLIPHLPLLENLSFTNCTGLDEMRIQNHHVETIEIRRDGHRLESWEFKTTIIAPNLVSFTYVGYSLLELSLHSPNLVNAGVELFSYPNKKAYDMEWYTNLINFLSELNCCKTVRILCENEKALIIPKELREIYPSPMPGIKHLKVEAFQPLYRKALIRKSLRWLSPSLESLTIPQF